MQLKFISLLVEDQQSALDFYTAALGFQKMADIPIGAHRWLTVVSPDGLAGVELVLEPLAFEPARAYQRALFEAGIPALALITEDIDADTARLRERGVVVRGEPQHHGLIRAVLFEDGCGNLVNLVQSLQ